MCHCGQSSSQPSGQVFDWDMLRGRCQMVVQLRLKLHWQWHHARLRQARPVYKDARLRHSPGCSCQYLGVADAQEVMTNMQLLSQPSAHVCLCTCIYAHAPLPMSAHTSLYTCPHACLYTCLCIELEFQRLPKRFRRAAPGGKPARLFNLTRNGQELTSRVYSST